MADNLQTDACIKTKQDNRNYGIDMLKIISMFMVVILHILGHGGVLDSSSGNIINSSVSWIMNIGAYCAVNVFALTSGYLMINSKFKFARIINLWLQVVFYSLVINILFAIFVPGSVGIELWIKALLPVSSNLLWYFTSYFGLFFFMPFINKMMNSISGRQTSVLVGIIFVLFSVIGIISLADGFMLGRGYSMLWLAALYIIGGAIKKYGFAQGVKKRWFAIVYILSLIIVWVSRIVLKMILDRFSFGGLINQNMLVNYLSPFVLVMSISLLLFFKDINLPQAIKAICKLVSPLSFAVYIIHIYPLIESRIIVGKFSYLGNAPVYILVGTVLLAAIAIFLACIAAEAVRVLLFRYARITKLTERLGGFLDKKIQLEL